MKRIKSGRFRSAGAKRGGKGVVQKRSRYLKKRQNDFIEALADASAQALGLTIDPAWRDGVKFNLRLVLDHAARVEAFSLPDEAEPAPVFHA